MNNILYKMSLFEFVHLLNGIDNRDFTPKHN